jgi:uncharacterized membrane protein
MKDKQKELINKAAQYLRGKGYFVARVAPIKGLDLIVFGEDKNKPIFVAVGDASKVQSIPMNSFGYSKRAKDRAARFVAASKNWMNAYCFTKRCEYDAVWVDGEVVSHGVNISPIV